MPEKKEKINKGRKFKIKTPGQERDFDTLVKFRKFQRYEQVEDVKLTDEDAAVNSIAGGGVDMAPNAKGVKVFMKRKRAVDGRSKGYREAVKRIKERNAKVVQKNLAQKLSQFGVTSNPFREETKMSNKKYLETKADSIEAAVLKSLETSVESNETEQTLTMPEKYLESKEGSLTDDALKSMMGEGGEGSGPQGGSGQRSSIGTPLKHKRSWNRNTHKLITLPGGGVKIVRKDSKEHRGSLEAEGVEEGIVAVATGVSQGLKKKPAVRPGAPKPAVAKPKPPLPRQMKDPKKEKMVGTKEGTKVVDKNDPKYANHPEHESVEFDETTTGWSNSKVIDKVKFPTGGVKKGSLKDLEKHNKDLRDKKAKKESKETEAGERDVGGGEYSRYVKRMTPGEKNKATKVGKRQIPIDKETQMKQHLATRIDDEYEPTEESVASKMLKKFKSDDLARKRARREKAARRQVKHEEVDVEEGIGGDKDPQNPSTVIKKPIDISGFKGPIKKIPSRKRDKKDPARAQGTIKLSRPVGRDGASQALPAHEDNDKKPIGQALSTKPPAVSDDEVEKFKKKNPDKVTVLKPSKKGMPKKNKAIALARGEEVEVESLIAQAVNELSKKTLGSYVKKASVQQATLARKSGEQGTVVGPDSKEYKRYKGIKKAADKLSKEEVEAVNELSKKTLGSYVKKASVDKSNAMLDLGISQGPKQTRADVIKHAGKAFKRQKGIDKAADKLSKEEVEVDEGGAYGGGLKDAAKKVKDAEKRLGITPKKTTTDPKTGVRTTTYKGKIKMGEDTEGDALVKAVANSPKQQALKKKQQKSAYQKNIDYDTARHAAKTKYMKKEDASMVDAVKEVLGHAGWAGLGNMPPTDPKTGKYVTGKSKIIRITDKGKKALKKGDHKLSITAKGKAAIKDEVEVEEGKVRDWLKKPLKGGDALRPGSGWEKRNDAAKKKKEEVEVGEGSLNPQQKAAREKSRGRFGIGDRKHGNSPQAAHGQGFGTGGDHQNRGVKKVRGAKEEVEEGRKVPGEQKPERVIDKINRIVKDKQYEKIHGQKVDLFTASAIQQVYDKINKNNQEKMEKVMSKDVRGLMKMAKFSMQQMK